MTVSYRYLERKPGSDAMAIAGRGLRVYTLFCAYEMGESAESLTQDRDLPLAAVFEALAYAYDHPDEMDKIRAADEEAEKYALGMVREDLRRIAEKTRKDDDRAYEGSGAASTSGAAWYPSSLTIAWTPGQWPASFERRATRCIWPASWV